MDAEVPAPKDSQDVHVGGSVQQAVELVGKMLEQVQIELEKMLSQRGEVPPEIDALENEKDESQKRYKDLESNYQKISEELKAFGRPIITPAKSGQVQAELNLAQAKKDIEKLRAEVEKLQAQCNDLRNELTKLQSQTTQRDSAFTSLEQKLETSQRDTTYYQQLSRRFRKIIQETHAPMAIDDEVHAKEFDWLRGEIYLIIHSSYIMRRVHPERRNPDLQIAETYLYNLFSLGLDEHELENAVRAFVFGRLDKSLLFKGFFGLGDMDESLGMEAGLRNFESMLNENHPDQNFEIAEWRTATMKCARLLQPVDPSRPPGPYIHVARELMWLLDPLLKDSQNETDQLMTRWQALCMKALSLTMKLRNSKDVYRCEIPLPGDVLEDDDITILSEIHNENCKKYAELNGRTIAYALSGALVKYSVEEPERKLVLVKPWVVTHVHPEDSSSRRE